MTLIRDGRLVKDHWQRLGPTEPLPPAGDVIVPWPRWQVEAEALQAHDGALGVQIGPEETAEELAPVLPALGTIVIEFPVFKDGRGYSTARLLRERYGFTGELRATGDVLIDQLFFLQRVGFDVLELRADQNVQDALGALRQFSVRYQAGADEALPLYRRR